MDSRPWAKQPCHVPEDDEQHRNQLYRTRSYGTTPSDSGAENSSDDARDEGHAQIAQENVASALLSIAQKPVEAQEPPVRVVHRMRSRDVDLRPQKKSGPSGSIASERYQIPGQVVRNIKRMRSREALPCFDLPPKESKDNEIPSAGDRSLSEIETTISRVSHKIPERGIEKTPANWTFNPSVYREKEYHRILAGAHTGSRRARVRSVGELEMMPSTGLLPEASEASANVVTDFRSLMRQETSQVLRQESSEILESRGGSIQPAELQTTERPMPQLPYPAFPTTWPEPTSSQHSRVLQRPRSFNDPDEDNLLFGSMMDLRDDQRPPRRLPSPVGPIHMRRRSYTDLKRSSGTDEVPTDNRLSSRLGKTPSEIYTEPFLRLTRRTDRRYKALNSDNSEIRLIKLFPGKRLSTSQPTDTEIRCSLFVTTLEEAPPFEALSYTWGDSSSKKRVWLDDEPFEVTQNLELALQNLRYKRFTGAIRFLWIDAICINQANENERSEQVSKMRLIYAHAKRVIVWLGGHANNSEEAFYLLKDLYLRKRETSAVEKLLKFPIQPKHLQGIANLFSREYFWRIWVIQEIHFAKALKVQCGTSSMDWDAIIYVQDMLSRTYASLMTEICENRRSLSELQPALSFRGPKSLLLDRTDDHTYPEKDLHLFDAIIMHRLKHATDPKDKVYALVGLTTARDDPNFVIDYSQSVRQIYINTVEYIIRTSGSLDIMCAKTKGEDETDFPSCVPDLGSSGANCPIPYRRASRKSDYKASKDRPCRAKVHLPDGILTATGVKLGTINKLSQPTGMQRLNHHYQAFKAFQDWHMFLRDNLAASSISKPYTWTNYTMFDQSQNHSTQFPETFARLILSDIISPRDVGDQPKYHYLNTIISAITVQSHRMYRQLDIYDGLQHATMVPTPRHSLKDWHKIIAQLFFKRRIFIMDDDTIGLAEEAVEEGDVAVVLFGCSIPVILRKVQGEGGREKWIYVSDAIVIGYMYGAALDELEAGKRKEEFFEIH